MRKIATAVEKSQNAKIGLMSATYAGEASCPTTCPLRNKGCYGKYGLASLAWRRLASDSTPLAIAKSEAEQIRLLSGKNNLRIHVLGDSKTNAIAKIIAQAASEYMAKFGKLAYTYTHAWRKVKRSSWGKVSVLASCENTRDVKLARSQGYATAIVVDSFKSEAAYVVDDVKIVPCPQQTGRAKTCNDCKLCMNDQKLRDINITIGFQAHGNGQNIIKETLKSLT